MFSRAPKTAPHAAPPAVPPPPSVGGVVVAPAVRGAANPGVGVVGGVVATEATAGSLKTAVGVAVGTTVAVATIASGVEAAWNIAEKLGYTPLQHKDFEGEQDRIKKDIEQSIKSEEQFPIRYCPDDNGKKLMVSRRVLFCPFDGSAPKEEEKISFEFPSPTSETGG